MFLVRPPLLRGRLIGVYQRCNVLHAPKPIGDPSGHRGRHLQRLVDAHEVVEHKVQRQRVNVRVDLFGEGVRQPREAAHVHPHAEVLPLDVRGRDVRLVRVAGDLHLLGAGALGRAVALLGARAPIGRLAVKLHQHGVVHGALKSSGDGIQVDAVAVRRELHPAIDPEPKIVHEEVGALGVAVADKVAHDQLRIAIERGPRPNRSSRVRRVFGGRNVLRLGVAKTPNLVALDALRLYSDDGVEMVDRTRFAGINEQLRHGVDRDADNALDGAHRAALAEHREDLDALSKRQLVHALLI